MWLGLRASFVFDFLASVHPTSIVNAVVVNPTNAYTITSVKYLQSFYLNAAKSL